jgi:hypothetical protein
LRLEPGGREAVAADAASHAVSSVLPVEAAEQQGASIALRFVGGNPPGVPEVQERAPGAVNYLRGSDPAGWQTQLPAYTQVAHRERWPRVDVLLRGQG